MPIIYYHNIISSEPDEYDSRADRMPLETFQCHMDCLRRRFHPISLPQYLRQLRDCESDPKAVVVTFDDGCYGVYTHAAPILRELGIPATVFVVTDIPDAGEFTILRSDEIEIAFRLTTKLCYTIPSQDNSTYPLVTLTDRMNFMRELKERLKAMPEERRRHVHKAVLDRLGVSSEQCREYARSREKYRTLTWDELRELHGQGWTIGSHTRTHRTLGQLDPPAIKAELEGSLGSLRRELGISEVAFAYPHGGVADIGPDGAQAVSEAGYSCGLSTLSQTREEWDNRYVLPRLKFLDIAVCGKRYK